MDDLVKAYFERNLSEAEAGELENLLKNSPEKAQQFAELSEKAYLATGLPAHQWPGHSISIPKIGGLGASWKWWLALSAASLGALLWHLKTQPPADVPVNQSAPVVSGVQNHLPQPAKQVIPQKIQVLPPQKQWEGDQLSVLVETEKSSLVTVRILDDQGKEVRALFAGVLDKGQWNFVWDGLLANGSQALNGSYKIQVQNGSRILSKTVHLDYK